MISKVANLDAFSRMVYLDIVYEDETNKNYFHSMLKMSDINTRNAFLALYPGNYGAKLEKWISEASTLSDSDHKKAICALNEIFDKIKDKIDELEKQTVIAKALLPEYRELIKSNIAFVDKCITDQMRELPYPPITKQTNADDVIIKLPEVDSKVIINKDIFDCIKNRKSRRKYDSRPLSIGELSYLLWATQGIRQSQEHQRFSLRNVPSGGARHPFETYLAINAVDKITPGVYRYLPFTNSLVFLFSDDIMKRKLNEICRGQMFAGDCSIMFIWTAIPYRTEYRYLTEAKKIILQDSGHLCQNLYLACESIECGTCGIGAYDQKMIDDYLRVDGIDEFTVYMASVGKQLNGINVET